MSASRWVAGCYVAVVGLLAGLGGLTENGRFYLAAIVLTLPAGLLAFLAVYLARGLLTGIGTLVANTLLPDGSDPAWPATAGIVANTLLFTAAAVGSVLHYDHLARRRRAPHA
ncbi:hypothetical protein ACWD4P_09470 [Kitasatospora sp. NPDC002543]